MSELFTPENLAALLALTGLEIVLGIDNIVFISILSGRLPEDQQPKARRNGLLLAMGMRILLLLTLSWVMGLIEPLFTVFGHTVSGRDIILLGGGLFLLAKATWEIHDKLEGEQASEGASKATSYGSVLFQIALLDIVFSLDSVITAVGMAKHISIMITAVMISVLIMMVFAGKISRFIEAHPTMKILALSFLLLIGMTLVVEGLHQHVPKGYLYFAMAFSLSVEFINIRMRKKHTPIELRNNPPHHKQPAPPR